MLAAYPLSAFADSDISDISIDTSADTNLSDIIFTDDKFDEDEISADEPEFTEDDIMLDDEDALLAEENAPWDGVSTAEPPSAEDGAYEVSNAAQLAWIAERVNTGTDTVGRYDGLYAKTIRLTDDIDLSGFKWTPIGNYYGSPFAGNFEGNNHTVRGLSLGNTLNGTQGGLFGCVIGSVSDLTVETYGDGIDIARSITPSNSKPWQNGIGIVSGTVEKRIFEYNNQECTGTISNCTAKGDLSVSNTYGEDFYAGGIAGRNNGGIISDCSADCNININKNNTSPNSAEKVYAGRIAGYNAGTITFSGAADLEDEADDGNTNTITINSSYPNAGTVAGGNSGIIKNLNNSAMTSLFNIHKYQSAYSQDINAGQISGTVEGGTIEGCSAEFPVVSLENSSNGILNIGGIAGAVITAEDLSDNNNTLAGGIISDCTLTNAQAIEEISTSCNIGGIIGKSDDNTAIITDCSSNADLSVIKAAAPVNIGGIAGSSSAVIDSCSYEGRSISIMSDSSINAGNIAGISNNTVTDCIGGSSISASSSTADSTLYAGGISGKAYGNISRSSFGGKLSASAVQAYTGGIAGFAGFGSNSVLPDSNSEKSTITKCSFTDKASVSGSYISGGIVGQASGLDINTSSSEGSISGIKTDSRSDDAIVAAGGIAGTADTKLKINNCYVNAKINSPISAGAVFGITGSGNSISTSYLSPSFGSDVTVKHQVSSSSKPEEIVTYGLYINKDVTGAESAPDGTTLLSSDEACKKGSFTSAADQRLNFDNVWMMTASSPELQYRHYSNSSAEATDIARDYITFHATLENPTAGQRVYIALYNDSGVFCGTTSAVCSDEYINSTKTKAEFSLNYDYNYWNNPKNYDDEGEMKPDDEWIPSDFVPASAKVFTWNEETGMQNVSSVSVNHYNISFDD